MLHCTMYMYMLSQWFSFSLYTIFVFLFKNLRSFWTWIFLNELLFHLISLDLSNLVKNSSFSCITFLKSPSRAAIFSFDLLFSFLTSWRHFSKFFNSFPWFWFAVVCFEAVSFKSLSSIDELWELIVTRLPVSLYISSYKER